MKVKFDQVFTKNIDGTLSPLRPTRYGNITIRPGVTLGSGVVLGGIDFSHFSSHELEIEEEKDGTIIIKGIY